MKKAFLLAIAPFCFLLSCQSEDIVLKEGAASSRSGLVSEGDASLPAQAVGSDPNFIEPIDPEGGGGAGGDINFILPTSPTIDNGNPLIIGGKAGAAFTQSGSPDGEMILFATAEPSIPRPLTIMSNARGLKMGVSFIYNGLRHIVRFYHSVATYNGGIYFWTEAQPVQVLIGTLQNLPKWQPSVWSNSGQLVKPSQWALYNGPVGESNGQLAISELSVNAQGKVTLKAVLTMPGKTIPINYVNWNRWE
ncbi:hypothetical protein [Dyadobacter sandarakinus]|uniref:Uncharacterized protein n=1 Tax=Dyadobacter sandarakinus TaxID=2747268 RepID=A0ABX7IB19_9BACT|nr:hypothetical protein [Dyadobacter sandarakinus]QRR02136.1 hypothetical protein HWI92_15095 [Dyadobacter sandarakinus]